VERNVSEISGHLLGIYLCIYLFNHLLFIFAFYESVKGKSVGYRVSHKCLLWN